MMVMMRNELGGRLLGLLLLALVGSAAAWLGGCSAEKTSSYRWMRSDGQNAELEPAREECSKRATDAAAKESSDRIAARLIINEFLKCMREKGWELEAEDDD